MKKNCQRGSFGVWIWGNPVLTLTGRAAKAAWAAHDWALALPAKVQAAAAWTLDAIWSAHSAALTTLVRIMVLDWGGVAKLGLLTLGGMIGCVAAAVVEAPGQIWADGRDLARQIASAAADLRQSAPGQIRQVGTTIYWGARASWKVLLAFGLLYPAALGSAWVLLHWGAVWWIQLIGALEWAILLTAPVMVVVSFVLKAAVETWFAYRLVRAAAIMALLWVTTITYLPVAIWGVYWWVQALGVAVLTLAGLAQGALWVSPEAREFAWGEAWA